MTHQEFLSSLIALGITTKDASRRQTAIAFGAKLTELGDTRLETTLRRKVQAWLSGEDGVPELLVVVLRLLEREQLTSPASARQLVEHEQAAAA